MSMWSTLHTYCETCFGVSLRRTNVNGTCHSSLYIFVFLSKVPELSSRNNSIRVVFLWSPELGCVSFWAKYRLTRYERRRPVTAFGGARQHAVQRGDAGLYCLCLCFSWVEQLITTLSKQLGDIWNAFLFVSWADIIWATPSARGRFKLRHQLQHLEAHLTILCAV